MEACRDGVVDGESLWNWRVGTDGEELGKSDIDVCESVKELGRMDGTNEGESLGDLAAEDDVGRAPPCENTLGVTDGETLGTSDL